MYLKFILCLSMAFVSMIGFSQEDNKAYQIAKKIDQANDGFKGETSKMIMKLRSAGSEITREMVSKMMEESDSESKSLLEFLIPKDVSGTKLLTWSVKADDDSQWIYLPAFKKTKRISSSTKSSSFMGSEFTYEDLRSVDIDKFDYKFISEEKKGDDLIWNYEKTPKEKSGYSKQVLKTSQKYMSPVEVSYYDRSDSLLKTAVSSDFKSYKVGAKVFWRPNKIIMKNVQTGKESELIWVERKLGVELSARDFAKRSLER